MAAMKKEHGYTLRAGDAVPCLQSDVYNVSLFIYIYIYLFENKFITTNIVFIIPNFQ